MRILFITHTRIGDAVLSSGVLHRLVDLHPGARFTIACGPLASSLFSAVPGLDAVVPITKQPFDGHWFTLWREVRATAWDLVVDLRRSLVSYFLRARTRRILGPARQGRHQVEYLSSVLGHGTCAPMLYIDEAHRLRARQLIDDGSPVLAVSPVAAKSEKTWPRERFAEAIAILTAPGGPCDGWRVAVFGADEDRAVVEALSGQVAAPTHLICGEPDLLAVHAALARCSAFLGNDSGIGHLAACAGIPTVAVFGPTDSTRYAPWGERCIAVAARDGVVASVTVQAVVDSLNNVIAGCVAAGGDGARAASAFRLD